MNLALQPARSSHAVIVEIEARDVRASESQDGWAACRLFTLAMHLAYNPHGRDSSRTKEYRVKSKNAFSEARIFRKSAQEEGYMALASSSDA